MFLSLDMVLKDIARLAKGFYDLYDIIAAPYIENENAAVIQLGFTFVHRGSQVIIRKPYRSNEAGEVCENSKSWEIRHRGVGHISDSYRTIGDVMDQLKIKRTEQKQP
jgi:hypothetical protein